MRWKEQVEAGDALDAFFLGTFPCILVVLLQSPQTGVPDQQFLGHGARVKVI